MDMDIEVGEFERTQTPSLIGETIRGNHHQGSELADSHTPSVASSNRSRSQSRPAAVLPLHNELDSTVSLKELESEGVLMNDEEGEFVDKVLDDEGHVKQESLHISQKLKDGENDVVKPKPKPFVPTEEPVDTESVHIFGGDGDRYIAPASKTHSSANSTPAPTFKVSSPRVSSPLGTGKNTGLLPDESFSLQEVIDGVNNGSSQEALTENQPEASAPEFDPSKTVEEVEPEVPDSAADIDASFTVPAGAREGLNSPLLSRAASQQRYTQGGSPAREGTGTSKPHLARGDSYHGALSNDDYVQPLGLGERKPRHDPGASLSKTASLNYLRSISRSRSRVANDRDAIGVDRGIDSEELKEEGALMGDQFSQIPELEDAIDRALNLVGGDEKSELEVPQEDEEADAAETKEEETDEAETKTGEAETPETPEKAKEVESSEVSASPAPAASPSKGVYVPKEDKLTFEDEPVYLFTSLAGGFQVSSRTSRLANILAANKITFTYKDLGTDESAKKIWKTYSGGKTLPGVVRGRDDFIGNWEDIEEANENYEVRSLVYETV
ncbi:unnamed protein product [Kuraishia capsulata CBS 1993]|uniref:Uncharacterized protein n=1 Tax=Kuraishia capsulata CBS 1993 TaxID=1382522 RepID=W6MWL4_9ASCO|nr:uncharacterized protein KUCA_T00003594001 [Kuraishia capsulata CBS 1993]CDK27615.1 unnamed protein product [Kuraishia capsulata CBS 1993]